MIECITLRPTWQGGIPVPAGTAVSLSQSEATYAESIGRVERVANLPPETPAEAADTAGTEKPAGRKHRKQQTDD